MVQSRLRHKLMKRLYAIELANGSHSIVFFIMIGSPAQPS